MNIKLLIPLIALFPSFAFAHTVDGNGFLAGLTHPVGGIDHLLAMLSVGILSTQLGNRHVWTVPLTFVIVMLIGGILGFEGINISMGLIEKGIVSSVILLGLVIASGARLPLLLIYLFVAFFGFVHGFAHGVEVPAKADPFYFAVGFVISTIIIHLVGVLIGILFNTFKDKGTLALRILGAVILCAGVYMLF